MRRPKMRYDAGLIGVDLSGATPSVVVRTESGEVVTQDRNPGSGPDSSRIIQAFGQGSCAECRKSFESCSC